MIPEARANTNPEARVCDSRGSGLTTARALGLTVYTPSLGPELWLGPESVPRLGGLLCNTEFTDCYRTRAVSSLTCIYVYFIDRTVYCTG